MKRIEQGVSDLPADLLRLILERLSLVDLLRAGSVSRTWYNVSRSCLPCILEKPRTPWLMWWEGSILLPSDKISCYMMNLEEKKRCYTIRGRWVDFEEPRIIGCSNGWVVLLDKKAYPCLLNPFTKTRIKVPPIEKLDPGSIHRVENDDKDIEDEFLVYRGNEEVMSLFAGEAAEQLEPQTIVMVDNENKVNGVLMRLPWGISYWRRGDEHGFTLDREKGCPPNYIMYEDNKLYVLNSLWNVEIWDFSNGTWERQSEIVNSGQNHPKFPIRDDAELKLLVRIGTGEFLIVFRFVEYHKGRRKELWEPYKMSGGKWEHTEALDGHAVFSGHNEPVALLVEQVNGCKGNAIYYSHCYGPLNSHVGWYNREEVGVFDLPTKTIENVFSCNYFNAAVWIVPNLSE